MKNKKILFYVPTILLFIYAIIYVPLLKYLAQSLVEENVSETFYMAYDVSQIMKKISIAIIIISVIWKIILNKERCNINKKTSIINIVVFIVLIITIVFLGMFVSYA